MGCSNVGDANPDIAGIGILLSFCIQAGIAIVISFTCYYWDKNKDDEFRFRGDEDLLQPREKKLEIAEGILLVGSDVQSLTGISLLVSAIIQMKTLSFYHLHIIYDTASFVGISYCAAIACSFRPRVKDKGYRYALIAIWAALFLTFTSMFGVRLRSWDSNIDGHCYNAYKLAKTNAAHPKFDHVYISLTCLYVFYALVFALNTQRLRSLVARQSPRQFRDMNAGYVLSIASLQFPLHLYSIFRLRASNESLVSRGSEEQQWGFGQIVAVTLLATNVILVWNGFQEYKRWRNRQR